MRKKFFLSLSLFFTLPEISGFLKLVKNLIPTYSLKILPLKYGQKVFWPKVSILLRKNFFFEFSLHFQAARSLRIFEICQKSYSHLEFENPTFNIRSKSIWTKSFISFDKKNFFWIFASFSGYQKHKDFWNSSKILFPLWVWKSQFLPYVKKSKSKSHFS